MFRLVSAVLKCYFSSLSCKEKSLLFVKSHTGQNKVPQFDVCRMKSFLKKAHKFCPSRTYSDLNLKRGTFSHRKRGPMASAVIHVMMINNTQDELYDSIFMTR